jgi:hypothetical protein
VEIHLVLVESREVGGRAAVRLRRLSLGWATGRRETDRNGHSPIPSTGLNSDVGRYSIASNRVIHPLRHPEDLPFSPQELFELLSELILAYPDSTLESSVVHEDGQHTYLCRFYEHSGPPPVSANRRLEHSARVGATNTPSLFPDRHWSESFSARTSAMILLDVRCAQANPTPVASWPYSDRINRH